MLAGKNILLGITGSIAAYKIPLLVRLLKKEKANVQVILTPSAHDFVTPLTLSTLSGNPVLSIPFNEDDGSWSNHVELGAWADLCVMAPVSANTLAKMAHGITDNLLMTVYLSAKCPVFFAPAMDLDMYKHPCTKRNIEILQSYGHNLIEPQVGELASGLCGAGRMEEPERIRDIIINHFEKKKDLKKKILISAGPTHERIDPVRFIGNHSSGKMGYALAEEAASRGADVVLVSGPVDITSAHKNIRTIHVTSADQMFTQCIQHFHECDVCIMAAAIADYTPAEVKEEKIKKDAQNLMLDLIKTKDVLAELGKRKKSGQLLVGFALETNNEVENAKRKLKKKNLDMIILNSLRDEGAGFGINTNKVCIIDDNENIINYTVKMKTALAKDIIDIIVSKEV